MTQPHQTGFKFSETFNNPDGKTSGSSFIGVLLGLLSMLAFILGIVGWFLELENVMEYLDHVLQFGFLSATLLGVRKVANVFEKKHEKNNDQNEI